MDFENIFREVGDFGRYQKTRLVLLSIPILVGVLHLYIQVFAAGKSDYWCKSWKNESCQDLNITQVQCEEIKKEISIPLKESTSNQTETEFEQCVKYNLTGLDFEAVIAGKETPVDKIPCVDGWVHDKSVFPSTIIIDFELVCSKSYLPNVLQSVDFVGLLVGSSAFGISADTFGRRSTQLFCYLTGGFFGIVTAFSANVWMYLILRFCTGTLLKGIGICCFVLANELVAPFKRVFVGNFMWLFYASGYAVLAGSAKLIPNWRILQLVVTLPYIPLLIIAYCKNFIMLTTLNCGAHIPAGRHVQYDFFVPESPRWLVNQKQTEVAEKVLQKIAKVNKRTVTDDLLKQAYSSDEEPKVIRYAAQALPNLLKITIGGEQLVMQMEVLQKSYSTYWAVQSLVYDGLSLSTSSLEIDPYISFFISGAIEVPAYFACMFAAEWLGRKGSTFSTILLGGILCCLIPFIRSGLARVAVATAGKFFITMSYSIVFTWGTELFPTALRSSGLGLLSMSSRIGGIAAPLILIFGEVWPTLPNLIFGSFSITAGFLCLLLPETKGKPLSSSTRDIKLFYRKIVSSEVRRGSKITKEEEKFLPRSESKKVCEL